MAEINLTDQNFEQEVLKSEVPVLVDFWAPWCGPCRMLGPIVEELARDLEGKPFKVGMINVDENTTMAGQYNVMSIPTLFIFKQGKVVEQFHGVQPKDKLKQALEKHS
ncbi:MAG: thioredoxin [Patescibacteria group bacterium]